MLSPLFVRCYGSRGLPSQRRRTRYEGDFGGSDRGVIEHLRRYAAAPLAAALAEQSRIAGDAYDWSLNDAKSI